MMNIERQGPSNRHCRRYLRPDTKGIGGLVDIADKAALWADMEHKIDQATQMSEVTGEVFNPHEGLSPDKKEQFFQLVIQDTERRRLQKDSPEDITTDPLVELMNELSIPRRSWGEFFEGFSQASLDILTEGEWGLILEHSLKTHPVFGQASAISEEAEIVARLYVIREETQDQLDRGRRFTQASELTTPSIDVE